MPLSRRTTGLWLAVFLVGALLVACSPATVLQDATDTELGSLTQVATGAQPQQSSDADVSEQFATVMSVLTSPRCMNCHPTDDRPRQRDAQIIHLFNVTRGEHNHGGPVQTCETCHHEENNPYSNVPGAPHWGLAPKTMGWLGMTHAEIAETLLDPAMNGDRTFDDLLHHMSEDALVLWAWDPGEGRTPPPVSHEEFVKALAEWLDAGAPIPSE